MTIKEPNNNENLRQALAESLAPAALSDMSDADIEQLLNDATAVPMSDATVASILNQTNPAHPSDRTVRLPRDYQPRGAQPGSSKEIVMRTPNPNRPQSGNGLNRGSVAALAVSAVCLLTVLVVTSRPTLFPATPATPTSVAEVVKSVWKDNHITAAAQDVLPQAKRIVKAAIGDLITTKDRERRRLSLPDGSVLFMNENTTAKIESLRKLNVTAGEVFVEVCPQFDDQNNREFFYVDTPNRKLTAIGTKFGVKATDDNTDLLVTQGKVKVDGVDETVTAGRFVRFSKSDVELSVAPRASEALNWTEDLMVAAPIVPRSKYRGGALISVDPNGQEMRLSMRKYHVDVHIEDGFARTTIDQTYFNHTSQRLEGTFKFPLPADASLSRLAMYVGPKLMEGGMAERQHARNTFEQIVHKMKDPALLEWVDGTTFKMRVFPLEPRQEKRLIISYSQRLNTAYGKTHYRFPAGHNLDTVGDWSTEIRVKDGADLVYKSPSHAMEAERAKGDLVLTAAVKNELFDRDVVLEIEDEWNATVPGASEPQAEESKPADSPGSVSDKVLAAGNDAAGSQLASRAGLGFGGPRYRLTRTVHEDHQYLMLRHRPELKGGVKKQNRDWVFLFETSGDRNPVLARAQIEVVRTLLKNAEHEDTFNIVTAGTRPKTFREDGVACEAKNIDEAIAWLEKSHLIGALDFERGLEESVRLLTTNPARPASGGDGNADDGVVQKPLNPRRKVGGGGEHAGGDDDRESFLVHVGSGLPVLGQTSEKELVANIPQSVRYVGVGVGKKWSRHFMKAAASRTGGYFTQINPDEKVNWRAFELLSILNAPRLLNVSVVDNAEKLSFLTYTESIAHGEEICAIARLPKDAKLPKSLVVAGELNGKAWSQAIDVKDVTGKADYLPRSWARLEIDRLIASGAAQHKADIVALSKAMYVMSPFTSLLVLENEAMYAQYNIDRGRKDHWALYPAPDTIKVVHEPFQREFARSKDAPKNVWETVLSRNWRSKSAPVVPITSWYLDELWDQYVLDVDNDGDGVADAIWMDLVYPGIESALADFDASVSSTTTWGRTPDLFDPVDRVRSGFSPELVGLASPHDFVSEFGDDAWRINFGTVPVELSLPVANQDSRSRAAWSPRQLTEGFFFEQADEFGVELGMQPGWPESLRRRRRFDLPTESKFVMPGGMRGSTADSILWDRNGDERQVVQELDDLAVQFRNWRDHAPVRLVLSSRPMDEPFSFDELSVLNGDVLSRSSVGMTPLEINPSYKLLHPGFAGGGGFGGGQPVGSRWGYRGPVFDSNGDGVLVEFVPRRELQLSAGEAVRPDYIQVPALRPSSDFFYYSPNAVGRELDDLRQFQLAPYRPVPVLDPSLGEHAPIFAVDPPGVIDLNGSGRFVEQQTLNYFYDGVHETVLYSPLMSDFDQLVQFELVPQARFLSDIIAHAPGMNSTRADLLGVVEGESKRKPKRGEIDEAARKLIQKARSTDWETVTLGNGDNAVQVHMDGAGRFAWNRTVSEGLGEQVLCDGEHLWHLYEEIGLGAKRDFTRFHRGMISRVAPWLVAPMEELTIGANVIAIDERTVAIVPLSSEPQVLASGFGTSDQGRTPKHGGSGGNEAATDSESTTESGKGSKPKASANGSRGVVQIHLIFAKNGRLKERRTVRVLGDQTETLARVVFGRKGTIKVFNGKGKQLAKFERPRVGSSKPFGGLEPQVNRPDLVILPLPYRHADTILARPGVLPSKLEDGDDVFSVMTEEDALALLAADAIRHNSQRMSDVVMSRFFKKGDTRAGLYVLMANVNPLRTVKAAQNGQPAVQKPVVNYQPNGKVSDKHKALIRFARHLATASTDNEFDANELLPAGSQASANDSQNGRFLYNICRARNTYYRWYQERAIKSLDKAGLAKAVDDAVEVVGSLRSPSIGWTILRTMQPHLDHSEFYAKFADAAKRYENAPHIAWFVRQERARALFKAKKPEEASKLFGELLTKTLQAGFNPGIDKELREQFIKHRGRRNWSQMWRQTATKLIEDDLLRTAIVLSGQLRDLGDVDVANHIFEKTIAKLEPEKRPDVATLAIARLRSFDRPDDADKLLTGMLENPWIATSARLWRYGSALAQQRGKTAESLRRLERAIAIEYITRPDVINLQETRTKYTALLQKYEEIADASMTLEQAPPKALVARIVRAADQWRSMEDDETQVCQLASRILTKLDERELAWDYATTPVGTQPGSASWQSLGRHLAGAKDIDQANTAFERAFEFEQTNPQILLEHATLLRANGRAIDAKPLLKRIAEGKWQPRFNSVKQNATNLLNQ